MKHPLVNVVGLLAIGIFVGRLVDIWVLPVAIAGILGCMLALVFDRLRIWFLPVIILLTGMVGISTHQQLLSPNDLRVIVSEPAQLATIQGNIRKISRRPDSGTRKPPRRRYAAEIQLNQLRVQRDEWKQAYGTIVATLEYDDAQNLSRGQTIELFGILSEPPGPFAPGMFDYKTHLANRGIYHLLRSEESSDLAILTPTTPSLLRTFRQWATKALSRKFDPNDPSIELIRAMALGWRTALNEQVAEPFMKSGTMHLFAISGLHVALIAGILISLLQFMRINHFWCGLIVIPALWFFTAATGWQASATRSSIMMSVIISAWSLRRPTDLLNTLSAAAMIILLWDPTQLFQTGFQLSFSVVGTIALVMPVAEPWLSADRFNDSFIPVALRTKVQLLINGLWRYGATAFTISFAAWMGSLPLIMHNFHLVVPVSLIANVIVVQFGAGALASAVGCLAFAPIIPFASELFANSAWFFMNLMIHVSQWFSELPLAWGYVRSPTWQIIVCYYTFLVLIFRPPKWIRGRLHLPLTMTLTAIITVSVWRQYHPTPSITLLPLGAGHAIFAENIGAENYLIDCGNVRNYEFLTREFLKSRGVNRIDKFVATHGDVNHVGAAEELLTDFVPQKIFLNAVEQRSVSYRSLNSTINSKQINVTRVFDGDTVGPFVVVNPGKQVISKKADDSTLVLLFEFEDTNMLFANDLSTEGLRRVYQHHPNLDIDTLIISPSVNRKIVHPAWLQQFKPDRVVIADSIFPASNRIPLHQKEFLNSNFPCVYFMSETGTIELTAGETE